MKRPRIASLLAAGTELVDRLGHGPDLVGRSHECDHPAWVERLPVLSRPTFDVTGSSAEIDARVRAKMKAGEPLYAIDEERLAALAPDVVISQTHCEVCAIGPGALEGGACALRREKVATFTGGTLEGVLADFLAVADVVDARAAGERLVSELRARVASWRAHTFADRPTVICLEWTDPPFAMGNWGPELIDLAGGRPLLGAPGQHSRAISWEDVCAADADVLVIAPCGFSLPRALGELPTLAARPGFAGLKAARADRIYAADGNLYFNRSGPSLFDTIDLLAELLHPGQFAPHFSGHAFVRVPAAPGACQRI